MTWFTVDGACLHASGGQTKLNGKGEAVPVISRKTIYAWVADGMRVARVGEAESATERDSCGRRKAIRMMFSAEFIDEYLMSKANHQPRLVMAKKGAA